MKIEEFGKVCDEEDAKLNLMKMGRKSVNGEVGTK